MLATFQIFVRNLKNSSLVLNVSPLDSIQTLKDYIESHEGIPSNIQRLVFQGKELRGENSLQEVQIQKNDTIYLALTLKGGGNTRSLFSDLGNKYEYSAHHRGPVCSLVVTNDNKHIVSGSLDGTITVFDVENKTGTMEKVYNGELATLAVTSDKKYIISSSYVRRKSIKIIDFSLQNCIHELSDTFATSLEVTQDNKHVICGTSDGSVKIFSLVHRKWVWTFRKILDYPITSIIVRGNHIICGTLTIKILSLTNRKCVRMIIDPATNTKKIVAVSQNLKYIAQGGYDHSIKVYSFWSGRCIQKMKNNDNYLIESIAISKNNRFLILLNSKSIIKFYEIAQGRCVSMFSKESTPYADFPLLRMTPDNQQVVMSDWRGHIKILALMA